MTHLATNPVCFECDRYVGEAKCAAFPRGIPDSIWINGDDHSEPVEGDGGLTFVSIYEVTSED